MTNNDLKALVFSVFSLFGFYNALSAISFLNTPGGKAELFLHAVNTGESPECLLALTVITGFLLPVLVVVGYKWHVPLPFLILALLCVAIPSEVSDRYVYVSAGVLPAALFISIPLLWKVAKRTGKNDVRDFFTGGGVSKKFKFLWAVFIMSVSTISFLIGVGEVEIYRMTGDIAKINPELVAAALLLPFSQLILYRLHFRWNKIIATSSFAATSMITGNGILAIVTMVVSTVTAWLLWRRKKNAEHKQIQSRMYLPDSD